MFIYTVNNTHSNIYPLEKQVDNLSYRLSYEAVKLPRRSVDARNLILNVFFASVILIKDGMTKTSTFQSVVFGSGE